MDIKGPQISSYVQQYVFSYVSEESFEMAKENM